MIKITDYLVPILIGILLGLPLGIYAGATITDNHAERYRTESINNAVSHALESTQTPLNCDDNTIIETIKGMAQNGSHVSSYKFFLEMSGGEEAWISER